MLPCCRRPMRSRCLSVRASNSLPPRRRAARLQRHARAASAAGAVSRSSVKPVGDRAQRFDVHPVRQPLDDVRRPARTGAPALRARCPAASAACHRRRSRALASFSATLQQVGVELDAVLQVLLVLAVLDLVQRRLRDVDVAALDQLGHLAVEERQQQRADVRAVDVGVGHDDDAVVAQLVGVEVLARPMPVPSAVMSVRISSLAAASRSAPSRR